MISRRAVLIGATATPLLLAAASDTTAQIEPAVACRVINESRHFSDSSARRIADALDAQLRRHVAPAWRCHTVPVVFEQGTLDHAIHRYPKSDLFLVLSDSGAGVRGQHGIHKGRSVAWVYVPRLQAEGWPVSATCSHEVIEMVGNPWVNRWIDLPWKGQVAFEICDPVQSNVYFINNVPVQNFLLPAWFDPYNKRGPWDHLGRCVGAFARAPGGVWITRR